MQRGGTRAVVESKGKEETEATQLRNWKKFRNTLAPVNKKGPAMEAMSPAIRATLGTKITTTTRRSVLTTRSDSKVESNADEDTTEPIVDTQEPHKSKWALILEKKKFLNVWGVPIVVDRRTEDWRKRSVPDFMENIKTLLASRAAKNTDDTEEEIHDHFQLEKNDTTVQMEKYDGNVQKYNSKLQVKNNRHSKQVEKDDYNVNSHNVRIETDDCSVWLQKSVRNVNGHNGRAETGDCIVRVKRDVRNVNGHNMKYDSNIKMEKDDFNVQLDDHNVDIESDNYNIKLNRFKEGVEKMMRRKSDKEMPSLKIPSLSKSVSALLFSFQRDLSIFHLNCVIKRYTRVSQKHSGCSVIF